MHTYSMIWLESTFILFVVRPIRDSRLKMKIERLDENRSFSGRKVSVIDFLVQLQLDPILEERLE